MYDLEFKPNLSEKGSLTCKMAKLTSSAWRQDSIRGGRSRRGRPGPAAALAPPTSIPGLGAQRRFWGPPTPWATLPTPEAPPSLPPTWRSRKGSACSRPCPERPGATGENGVTVLRWAGSHGSTQRGGGRCPWLWRVQSVGLCGAWPWKWTHHRIRSWGPCSSSTYRAVTTGQGLLQVLEPRFSHL